MPKRQLCAVADLVTPGTAEMVTYLPISSPFIRFASRYMDEAMGFAAGWNFFVFEAILACRTARLFSSIGLMSSRFHSKLLLAMLSSTIGVILSQLEASLLL